ncbi:hypothetical protein AMTRI_Chr01g131180 [Amborella trichopoda]
MFPSCTLLLRLRGGKGRLRLNAEKKIRAEEEERKLEKIAEEFLKKQSKSLKKKYGKDADNYREKYREETAKYIEEVEEAVKASFDLCKGGKRRVLHELEAG